MRLPRWMDPDNDWLGADKLAHGVMGFALGIFMLGLHLQYHLSLPRQLAVALLVSVAYELGQTDTAASANMLGKPGYGFGLLDIVWDMVGVCICLALFAIACPLVW